MAGIIWLAVSYGVLLQNRLKGNGNVNSFENTVCKYTKLNINLLDYKLLTKHSLIYLSILSKCCEETQNGSVVFSSRAPALQRERHAFTNSSISNAFQEVATKPEEVTACLLFARHANDFGTEEHSIVG